MVVCAMGKLTDSFRTGKRTSRTVSHEINHHQPFPLVMSPQYDVAVGTHRSIVASRVVNNTIVTLATLASPCRERSTARADLSAFPALSSHC